MKKLTIIGLMIFLVMAMSVVAVQTNTGAVGLDVTYFEQDALKVGETVTLPFDVYNKSTGQYVANNTTCDFYVTNSTGDLITSTLNISQPYTVSVTGSDVYGDVYDIKIICRGEGLGGFVAYKQLVTNSGEVKDDLFTNWLMVLLPIVFCLLFWILAFKLDSTHQPFKLFLTLLGFTFLWFTVQAMTIMLQDYSRIAQTMATFSYVYGWVYWIILVYVFIHFVKSIFDWVNSLRGGDGD